MTERRRAPRITVNGRIGGIVVYTHNIQVEDISMTGVRFHTDKGIPPGHRCSLTLEYKGNKVRLKGTVVRSTLISMKHVGGEFIPIYEIAISLDVLPENTQNTLKALLQAIENEKGP